MGRGHRDSLGGLSAVFIFDGTEVTSMLPTQPDTLNPAIGLWLTVEDRMRRITDLGR